MGCNVSKEHQLENQSESGAEDQTTNGSTNTKEGKGSAKSKKGGSKKDQAPPEVQPEVNCVVTAPDSEVKQTAVTDDDHRTKGEGAATRENGDANNQGEEEDMEIDPNDPQMNAAAAKIQASFRGHKVRKELKKTADEIDLPTPREDATTAPRAEVEDGTGKEEEEEVDIDLTDPDVEKAATKIQASFRGYQVRKTKNDASPTADTPGS